MYQAKKKFALARDGNRTWEDACFRSVGMLSNLSS